MKSFVEMWHRPFRPPRVKRHLFYDTLCMDWQVGTSLRDTEIIEYVPPPDALLIRKTSKS